MQLHDVRAIVTGAAGGLGHHCTVRLLEAGAAVVAGDLDLAGLRALRRSAAGLPGRLEVEALDVTDEASVGRFVDLATERLQGLNGLLHCAGVLRDALLVQPAEGATEGGLRVMPTAAWRRVLEVNLTGAFLMTREVAARLVAARQGSGQHGDAFVIHMSSVARAGNPGQANYAASKAGVDAATRTWALELAAYGIRAGAIAPGVTETSFLQGISEARLAELKAGIPLGRLGRADDVWQAVRFLIECEFFTGRVLEVDGGSSMGH